MVNINILYFYLLNFIFFQTRQLDLGSNNIMNLHEFRNLHLNNLVQISFASNQVSYFEQIKNFHYLFFS